MSNTINISPVRPAVERSGGDEQKARDKADSEKALAKIHESSEAEFNRAIDLKNHQDRTSRSNERRESTRHNETRANIVHQEGEDLRTQESNRHLDNNTAASRSETTNTEGQKESAKQAQQPSEATERKGDADSKKATSTSNQPEASPSELFKAVLRGTKQAEPPSGTPKAETHINQQPQTPAQQELSQAPAQQTPQPKVANAQQPAILKGQPGLPEQPLGEPQPQVANAQQQPGQTKQAAGPRQPGQTQGAAQPTASGQPGKASTEGDSGKPLPDVHVFNHGERLGAPDPEVTQKALKMQVMAQMMFRGGVPQAPMSTPSRSDSGQTVADIRRNSSKKEGEKKGGEGKGDKVQSSDGLRRRIALGLRQDMGVC